MLYECWERKQIFNVLITILVKKKKIFKKSYNKLQAQWCTYTCLIKLGPSEKSYQRQKKPKPNDWKSKAHLCGE